MEMVNMDRGCGAFVEEEIGSRLGGQGVNELSEQLQS